jgi:hypothetical protein
MEEIWGKIKDCPGYSVSNSGRVRSDRYNKILKHSINKFLAEKFFCQCWHEFQPDGNFLCKKCGRSWPENNPDYFTWPGFGLVWEKAKESEGWFNFQIYTHKHSSASHDFVFINLINPEIFSYEWAKFLGWKGGKGEKWKKKIGPK